MLTSGDIDAVRLVGPTAPATNRRLPSIAPPYAARAREPRAVAIEFIDDVLQAVVRLGDAGRGKRVGLEDVRARHRIGKVDVLDRLRLRQRQQVVVALQMAFAADEALAAEMALLEPKPLNLRPHRAVEDQDALARRLEQLLARFASARGAVLKGCAVAEFHGGPTRFQNPHNYIKISLCNCNRETWSGRAMRAASRPGDTLISATPTSGPARRASGARKPEPARRMTGVWTADNF